MISSFGLWVVLASAAAAPGTSTTAPPRAALEGSDLALARTVELEPVLARVLAHNPDLAEVKARSEAAAQRASAAGRLPDLELQYQMAGTPLMKPWALDEADWHMLGLRQSIPAPGTLAAREKSAGYEHEMALATAETKRAELVLATRRAYADYYRTDREYRAHEEHAGLSRNVIELARSTYRAGRGPISDVLRTSLELSRLHRSQLDLDQERTSAMILLNTLMGRAPDAPLGPPGELELPERLPAVERLEAALDAARPEIRLAERAVKRSEAALEGAERSAKWPSFMVGLDYMFMPKSDMAHAYGAMVGINLPWLSARRDEEVKDAERSLSADRHALLSVTNASRLQLRDAASRYRVAERSLKMLDDELLPQAKESFEAARAGFTTGTTDALSVLDALRSYLEIRIEEIRTRSSLAIAGAELERAAGGLPPLDLVPTSTRTAPSEGGRRE